MLGYVRDPETPKQAWESLKEIFTENTRARKLQFCQQLNNLWQREMCVPDYTLKIKEVCELLDSINVTVEEEEMV